MSIATTPIQLVDSAIIKQHLSSVADELMASLPDPERLTTEERRGIIARYSAVLEGNFIYWMTGAYLGVKSDEAHAKIIENLTEEVRDCHPGMLRKFVIEAKALPTDTDAEAVYEQLSKVRLFVGRLTGVPMLVMMAFFEGWIQRFMEYLADLARRQGSNEMVYTDVHGLCDITHTEELFNALELEMTINCSNPDADLYEGVDLLRDLIKTIIRPNSVTPRAT
jgi:DNA-binding Lrp family transcriptional regulator